VQPGAARNIREQLVNQEQARSRQEHPVADRSRQDQPGAANCSQEQPGAARSNVSNLMN